ncbi:PLP-dependent aminotransferase family protein [Mycobacterium sp. pUA109]|uniref:MocR-like pyridoxine biosynthesis transcription factor PdxR n=1 Tax=Mycobacterium sp. pUA109 TaxID=3238982 RepID=UPI00351B4EC4
MTSLGATCGPEVLVELDRDRPEPLHRQLTGSLRDAIRTGRLWPETRMPSSRVLAADLGVSRRLVVEAFAQLVAEGFLVSRHGAGTYVARIDTRADTVPADEPPVAQYDVDFSPGLPDLRSFPRGTWIHALRRGLADLPSESLGYVSPQGLPGTRRAVADYLRRTRGIVAGPDRVVLCSGVTQGLSLVARMLRQHAKPAIAVEDPGFWLHRGVIRGDGIEGVPIPVDAHGLDVAVLRASTATAVLTTPAHQSPTGVVMSAARRADLLEWAHAGNLVIEDDYDAEFRYDRRPIGALQGLAPEHVIYLGSVSKTLAPGLRIGWIALPANRVGVAAAKGLADGGISVTDQIALAELLNSGEYDRHLRQMRRRYLSRRNALLAALEQFLPSAVVVGAAAGVQLMARFPADCDIDALVQAAAALGIRVESTRRWYADPDAAPPGLVMGYANLTESQITTGIQLLARAARQTAAAA